MGRSKLRLIVDNSTDPLAWCLIAFVTIGAPLIEEVMYRGFLQSAILRLTGSPWLAILLTSAVFTAIHLPVVQPHALPVLAVLSLAMGVAFERSKSLAVPIGMHVAFNILNIAIALAIPSKGL